MTTERGPIECWLTDMDGVLVHEEKALPGAAEFLERLVEKQRRFLVLTNNSIFTPRDLAARLARAGLQVPDEYVRLAVGVALDEVGSGRRKDHVPSIARDPAAPAGAARLTTARRDTHPRRCLSAPVAHERVIGPFGVALDEVGSGRRKDHEATIGGYPSGINAPSVALDATR